jgi:hypothetical protein
MFLGVANTTYSLLNFASNYFRFTAKQRILFTVLHKYLLNICLIDCNYFGSMTTNEERCVREIKSRIFMAKATIHKKKNLFTRKLCLNLRKKIEK